MTKSFFITILLVALTFLPARSQQAIKIIPEPVSIIQGAGSFELPKEIKISAPATKELEQTLKFLRQNYLLPPVILHQVLQTQAEHISC